MNIIDYYNELKEQVDKISVVNEIGTKISLAKAADELLKMVGEIAAAGKKIMFIGNGGSAAIASHMAVDYWKNGGIKAIHFNNDAQLTCLSNDCGYEQVFSKPIEMFAEPGDILIAISSSGRSANILNGVKAARAKHCSVVTLSGFAADNPLARLGDLNFYVPSSAYSHVEIIHHTICHYMLDMIMERKAKI